MKFCSCLFEGNHPHPSQMHTVHTGHQAASGNRGPIFEIRVSAITISATYTYTWQVPRLSMFLMVHRCSFIVHLSNDAKVYISALIRTEDLKPLECSCHIVAEEHSRACQGRYHPQHLVTLVFTHPSTRRAEGCLTSLTKCDVLDPIVIGLR